MKTYLLLLFLIGFQLINAQSPLPRYLTDEEKSIANSFNFPEDIEFTGPPPSEVRTVAEWEEMQAVIISWKGFNSILSEIISSLKEAVDVFIVCDDETSVKMHLDNQGIDYSENVFFYEIPSNSIWVRDYGPNSAYLKETGELVWIDWIYNRPRYKDNDVPTELGKLLGIEVYSTNESPEDLVNTGGNFMSDGLGTGFSSDLVLDENGPFNNYGFSNHSEEEVDEIMNTYMGIDNYIKMQALPYDLIHHIDMHMKLLDEETILVGQYPEEVADGPQIEANIQYVLNNFQTPYGNPYNIVRIPMPPASNGNYPDFGGDYRTYANALFANNKIIVPFYEEKYDTTAQRIWEENMPGYDIIGIDCNNIIPLSGALHCITKEVAVDNPITITMQKYKEQCSDEAFVIEADIKSYSDVEEVNVIVLNNNESNTIPMLVNSDGSYEADLGFFEMGDEVSYYIEATNVNGKKVFRPLPGESGPRTTSFINCSVVNVSNNDLAKTKIYPNPANSITCIETNIKNTSNLVINLLDVAGKNVKELYNNNVGAFAQKVFIDASLYKPGTYFVQIKAGGLINTQKLIIAQ